MIGRTADGKGPILLHWKAKPKKVVFGLLTEAGI
jgi:hypothetical protein